MNGNLRRLREGLTPIGRELGKRSEVAKSTLYRAEHGLAAVRPSTISESVRVPEVSPAEVTSWYGSADDDCGRQKQ